MYRPSIVEKAVAHLPVIAGSLLIGTAVANAAFANFGVIETGSASFGAIIAGMLGIPGGIVAPHAAPEIDLDSVGNGIALLCGGILLLVGLRRKTETVR
jgi:hypothetical protein